VLGFEWPGGLLFFQFVLPPEEDAPGIPWGRFGGLRRELLGRPLLATRRPPTRPCLVAWEKRTAYSKPRPGEKGRRSHRRGVIQ